MKEKFKFRGKRNGMDEWVYGYYLYDKIHDKHFILSHNETGVIRECLVNPETVGQFTGELDRNKKEIYADDILKTTSRSDGAEPYHFIVSMPNHMLAKAVYIYEIIGNKFDNKELLDENKRDS